MRASSKCPREHAEKRPEKIRVSLVFRIFTIAKESPHETRQSRELRLPGILLFFLISRNHGRLREDNCGRNR